MKNYKVFVVLFLMTIGFSFQTLSQVPSGYTVVKTHKDDITWYEVRDSSGDLGAVYNNKLIYRCSSNWTSVSYSHGYFFYQFQGEDLYFVYDKYGREVKREDGDLLIVSRFEEINGKLYMYGSHGIYDEICKLIGYEIREVGDVSYLIKKGEYQKRGLYDLTNGKQILSPIFDQLGIIEDINGEVFVKAMIGGLNGTHNPSSTGLYNIAGEEILAPEFQDCAYLGSNLFKFKMNGYWGVMNRQGKIIIPISRHYTSIDYSRTLKMFTFTKETDTQYFKGECDANGVQTSIEKTGTKNKPQQQSQQPAKQEPKQEVKQETKPASTPTPLPQPQAMQVWNPCVICKGSGLCTNCGGSGQDHYSVSTYRECPTCHGMKKCSYCAGQGGHYEVEYH